MSRLLLEHQQRASEQQCRSIELRVREAIESASTFYLAQFDEYREKFLEREKILGLQWEEAVVKLQRMLTEKRETIRAMHASQYQLRMAAASKEGKLKDAVNRCAVLEDRIRRLNIGLLTLQGKNQTQLSCGESSAGGPPGGGGGVCVLCLQALVLGQVHLQHAATAKASEGGSKPLSPRNWTDGPQPPKRPSTARTQPQQQSEGDAHCFGAGWAPSRGPQPPGDDRKPSGGPSLTVCGTRAKQAAPQVPNRQGQIL
jgi:hypothetical protein